MVEGSVGGVEHRLVVVAYEKLLVQAHPWLPEHIVDHNFHDQRDSAYRSPYISWAVLSPILSLGSQLGVTLTVY